MDQAIKPFSLCSVRVHGRKALSHCHMESSGLSESLRSKGLLVYLFYRLIQDREFYCLVPFYMKGLSCRSQVHMDKEVLKI